MLLSEADGTRTRDNTSNQDQEPDRNQHERRPRDTGEAKPADPISGGDQIEPENDELWEPEDFERSQQHLENQFRKGQALGDIFCLYKCDFEGLSTGDQRYLRQPIRTDLGRNQEALEQRGSRRRLPTFEGTVIDLLRSH